MARLILIGGAACLAFALGYASGWAIGFDTMREICAL